MTSGPGSYSKADFTKAVERLDLNPPVSREQVVAGYRRQVRRFHPDRFLTPAEKGVATLQLQEINAARDYVLQYLAHNEVFHSMSSPRVRPPAAVDDSRPEIHAWDILERGAWTDVLFTPITTVHIIGAGLSTMVALPFLRATRGIDHHAVDRIFSLWQLVGPHLATLALFLAAEPGGLVKPWFGLAFITMLIVEVFAQVSGAAIVAQHRDEVVRAETRLSDESGDN